jgi:hypothetical protein
MILNMQPCVYAYFRRNAAKLRIINLYYLALSRPSDIYWDELTGNPNDKPEITERTVFIGYNKLPETPDDSI